HVAFGLLGEALPLMSHKSGRTNGGVPHSRSPTAYCETTRASPTSMTPSPRTSPHPPLPTVQESDDWQIGIASAFVSRSRFAVTVTTPAPTALNAFRWRCATLTVPV